MHTIAQQIRNLLSGNGFNSVQISVQMRPPSPGSLSAVTGNRPLLNHACFTKIGGTPPFFPQDHHAIAAEGEAQWYGSRKSFAPGRFLLPTPTTAPRALSQARKWRSDPPSQAEVGESNKSETRISKSETKSEIESTK